LRERRCGAHSGPHLVADLAAPVTFAELAAVAHCSPFPLARHFRQVTGMSPLQLYKRLEGVSASAGVGLLEVLEDDWPVG
jgi:AraC-like DNA-binding protein